MLVLLSHCKSKAHYKKSYQKAIDSYEIGLRSSEHRGGAAHFHYDCQMVERPSMDPTLGTQRQRRGQRPTTALPIIFKGTEIENGYIP